MYPRVDERRTALRCVLFDELFDASFSVEDDAAITRAIVHVGAKHGCARSRPLMVAHERAEIAARQGVAIHHQNRIASQRAAREAYRACRSERFRFGDCRN